MAGAQASRFKVRSEEDRRLGIRIVYLRRVDLISQRQLADSLGFSLAQMANVESGRVSIRLSPAWKICRLMLVHPCWLATGAGELLFDYAGFKRVVEVDLFVASHAESLFRDEYPRLVDILGYGVGGKQTLTRAFGSGTTNGVSSEKKIPTWKQLVAKLKQLTKAPGMKSRLASEVGTSRQNIHKWMTSDAEPGAELALKVFQWVRDHEK